MRLDLKVYLIDLVFYEAFNNILNFESKDYKDYLDQWAYKETRD